MERRIGEHPRGSRQRLSYRICEALDWRKPEGGLKDRSCRVAMPRMHREGLIEWPAPRHKVKPCRSFERRTAQAEPGPLLGAADYPGAERVFCAQEALQAGARSPACERSRRCALEPLVRLRFKAQPLGLATRYERERLRCGGCGALFVAHGPPEAGPETYERSLKVNLAVAHDHRGLAFKRMESFPPLVGMPWPDATPGERVEQVADRAYPVYEYRKTVGAKPPRLYQEDTAARILSVIQENQADPAPERTGM